MAICKTRRVAGAVLAILTTSVGASAAAQAPCVTDFSATCVVDAVQSLYLANIDRDDGETYLPDEREIGSLAWARILLGDDANARALTALLTPVELARGFVDGEFMGYYVSTVDPAVQPRMWVGEAGLSWLESLDADARTSSAFFKEASSTARLFAWTGQSDTAKRIISETIESFAAAIASGEMNVLRASSELLRTAWEVGSEDDVETLLDILMRPEMAEKGICPDWPHWTNETSLRMVGHRFLARGEFERAEAVWRATKEIDDDWIESYLRAGPEELARKERLRAFSTSAHDPEVTPRILVEDAREIWPDVHGTDLPLHVFRQLVNRESNLDLPSQFLDVYPDLARDFIALLPAWSFEGWEAADHCEGVACVGWGSQLFSDPDHRQAICVQAEARADAFFESPTKDEGQFADLALAAIWVAEFCAPAAVSRITAFAEPLIFEIRFSGMGATAVGYLSVASYAADDDETGARIVGYVSDSGYQAAYLLLFMAMALEELGHNDKAEVFIRRAWDVAAPYVAEANSDDPYYPSQFQTFVSVAQATAAIMSQEGRSTGR